MGVKSRSPIPKLKKAKNSVIGEQATILKKSPKELYWRLDFTYLDVNAECFSAWQKDNLKKLSGCIKKMRERDKKTIKINPSGSECTKNFVRHMNQFAERLSEDILPIRSAQHLYVGDSERLHGFTSGNIFYVLQLDYSHKINKG